MFWYFKWSLKFLGITLELGFRNFVSMLCQNLPDSRERRVKENWVSWKHNHLPLQLLSMQRLGAGGNARLQPCSLSTEMWGTPRGSRDLWDTAHGRCRSCEAEGLKWSLWDNICTYKRQSNIQVLISIQLSSFTEYCSYGVLLHLLQRIL